MKVNHFCDIPCSIKQGNGNWISEKVHSSRDSGWRGLSFPFIALMSVKDYSCETFFSGKEDTWEYNLSDFPLESPDVLSS